MGVSEKQGIPVYPKIATYSLIARENQLPIKCPLLFAKPFRHTGTRLDRVSTTA